MATIILSSREKIKSLVRGILLNRELFPAILITVVGIISFGLGRLSVSPLAAVPQGRLVSSVASSVPASLTETDGEQGSNAAKISSGVAKQVAAVKAQSGEKKYVASKNGTKYHLPWCSGASHIAEGNKIWFASKEEAKAAGYTPAGNCKGI